MPKEEGKKKIDEDASLLRRLITSLDESESKLEEFYEKKDADNFNKTKKFILQITHKISEIAK
jgi:hypothetical protein